MRTKRFGRQLSFAALGVLATLLVGCAAATDPSPSLTSISRTDAEIAKTYTVAKDENYRQIIEDLERAFYTERPSRLTPMPIPH